MPPKKDPKATSQSETAPPPKVEKDEVPEQLKKLYLGNREARRADLIDFNTGKYHHWVDYFGFSMERELQWGNVGAKRAASFAMRSRRKSLDFGSPKKKHRISAADRERQDPFEETTISKDAGLGLAESTDYTAVDAHALQCGPCEGLSPKDIATRLTAPYAVATWKMSSSQCANFKCRALARWICEFIKLLPPMAPPAETPRPAGLGAGVGQQGGKPGTPQAAAMAPEAKGAKGGKSGAPANTPPPPPTSPDGVLAAHAGDPTGVAKLFAAFCLVSGLECQVVPGTLKGALNPLGRPLYPQPWCWNVVLLPPDGGNIEGAPATAVKTAEESKSEPKQYLLDIASMMAYVGPRGLPTVPSSAMGGAPGAGASSPPKKADMEPFPFVSPASNRYPIPQLLHIEDLSKHFEPFYFLTNPMEFAATHFPDDETMQLLERSLRKAIWEIYPRLGHEFFKHKVKLDSNRRRCIFAAKATPIAITFLLDDPMHTDLCVFIFKGAFSAVDVYHDAPIDPRFIWTTREEAEGRITFNIMLPDVGLYTVAVGARRVNDPDAPADLGLFETQSLAQTTEAPGMSDHVGSRKQSIRVPPTMPDASSPTAPAYPSRLYDLVVVYQVNVAFVPVNEPMFPLQHLMPTTCKLLGPVRHKMVAGTNTITVIPTTPMLRAVAIVNRIFKPSAPKPVASLESALVADLAIPTLASPPQASDGRKPGAAEGGKKQPSAKSAPPAKEPHLPSPRGAPGATGAPTPAPPVAAEISQIKYHFLPFDAERAVFEGSVPLEIGHVEIWVLVEPPEQAPQDTDADPMEAEALFSRYLPKPQQNEAAAAPTAPPTSVPPIRKAKDPEPAAGRPSDTLAGSARAAPTATTASSDSPGVNFVPFVSELACVRRIPAKELNVNEGKPLIVPDILDWAKDRPYVCRLLSGTTSDGRQLDRAKGYAAFHAKPFEPVGMYFAQKLSQSATASPFGA